MSMWGALFISAALAQQGPPECELESGLSADTVSVAWVAPVRKRAGNNAWLEVVKTAELRDWVRTSKAPGIGPMLHTLGLRKNADPPRRRYKVTIFEVRGDQLCGSDAELGLDSWTVRWRDVARRGFCMLPAERFVAEG